MIIEIMKKTILMVLFFACQNAIADDGDFGKKLLVVGKFSGGCGILVQQMIFQESTGLDNGDKFITRFWMAEAARLGMTLEDYSSQCKTVNEEYSRLYGAFDKK